MTEDNLAKKLRFFCYGCEQYIGEGTAISGCALCDDCEKKEAEKKQNETCK